MRQKPFQEKLTQFLGHYKRTDRGTNIIAPKVSGFTTFGQLKNLHIADIIEVNKPLGRSNEFALRTLKKNLGKTKNNKY